jgi:methionyl-tRNA formyltransferase
MWQAYTPWPGIYTMYEGKRFLLENVSSGKWKVESGKSGTVVKLEDGSI